MRTQSPSSFMPIVVQIDEPSNAYQESFDEPFDLDRECDAFVRDVAQFTLQRLKQHLDEQDAHEEVVVFGHDHDDETDKAA